jgi:hypothetical protein
MEERYRSFSYDIIIFAKNNDFRMFQAQGKISSAASFLKLTKHLKKA